MALIKVFLLLIALAVSAVSQASCQLPVGETLTIGCSYHCDFTTRFRIRSVAARMGYKVKFVNLALKGDVNKSLLSVDSILIPGGADIHPKYYLKKVTPELQEYTRSNLHLVNFSEEGTRRDIFEYTLLRLFLSPLSPVKKMPLLGICRGMQMMSVAQGIPLYLDIKTELGIPNRMYKFDKIHIEEEGLMSSLYGHKKFRALELHHQGIRTDYFEQHKNDYPNIIISSFSNDRKIAESIEYKNRNALGVQFHPEKSLSKAAIPVFRWFLTKACEYKKVSKELL